MLMCVCVLRREREIDKLAFPTYLSRLIELLLFSHDQVADNAFTHTCAYTHAYRSGSIHDQRSSLNLTSMTSQEKLERRLANLEKSHRRLQSRFNQ